MTVRIACIVEGHGETESVPVLIRRIADAAGVSARLDIHTVRVPKSKLLKQRELERAAELAALRTGGNGAILLLIDSDDDCPARLAPALLNRLRAVRADLPVAVVLANREFESWFLAAAESLRGHRHLPLDLESPSQPEAIRGAKEWLQSRAAGHAYSRADQPALTAVFDLESARRAPSFDKCYREVKRLIDALAS